MNGLNQTIVLVYEIAEIEALKQEIVKLKQAARDRVKPSQPNERPSKLRLPLSISLAISMRKGRFHR